MYAFVMLLSDYLLHVTFVVNHRLLNMVAYLNQPRSYLEFEAIFRMVCGETCVNST
jgi:hypothetical protein